MSSGPLSWAAGHAQSLGLAAGLSVGALAVTVFASPWLVARLPADHFSRPPPPPATLGPARLAVLFARNAAGLAAVLIGLVMMVTPGPGLVMIVVGLSLADFPGRHALVARLAARPRVFAALNWLRRRRDAPPFIHPAVRPGASPDAGPDARPDARPDAGAGRGV